VEKLGLKLKLISPRLPNAIVQSAPGRVPCTIASHRKDSNCYLDKTHYLFISPVTRLQSTGSANFAASIHSAIRVLLPKCTASIFAALTITGKRFQLLKLDNLMEGIGKMPLKHSSFSSIPAFERDAAKARHPSTLR
jgi:hypothetical protein